MDQLANQEKARFSGVRDSLVTAKFLVHVRWLSERISAYGFEIAPALE